MKAAGLVARWRNRVAIIIAILFFIGWGFYPRESKLSRESFMMDTIIRLDIYSKNKNQATETINAALALMNQLDKEASRHNSLSETGVSFLNRSAGENEIILSEELFFLLGETERIAAKTEGAFHPGLGKLLDLWKEAESEGKLPADSKLRAALERIEEAELILKRGSRAAYITEKSFQIDLGGSAKGYITDRAAELLRSSGIKKALLDVGGNIVVIGRPAKDRLWRIGIVDPLNPGEILGHVEISDKAVVTAGVYQRYFLIEEEKYHHILDPQTGYPADGSLSATVVSSSGFEADILSTALVILGPERGLEMLKNNFPATPALLATEDGRLYLNAEMREIFYQNEKSRWSYADPH